MTIRRPDMADKPTHSHEANEDGAHDYRDTLFLPTTDFPMRAGLPTSN